MRNKLFLILFFFVYPFVLCLSSQKTDSLRIGIISDIHYLSEQLMDDGEAINSFIEKTGRNILAVPEILDTVIKEYLQSDIDFLFIPGDLTKDGEKKSHEDLIQKLTPLLQKGIKVFVIPGNHDINIPHPVGFKKNKTYPTSNISAAEFASLYHELGYGMAIDKDTASLSYVAELNNKFLLLAIDAARYDEYTTSSITAGKIKPETKQWIIQILRKARKENKEVIGMMHHGLVEHFSYQSMLFGQYLVDDWERLASIFADEGMEVIFTGHFHATDITQYTSEKDCKIYDIETGALCSFPFAYRHITLFEKGVNIETRNLEATSNFLTLAKDSKEILFNMAKNIAKAKISSMGLDMGENISEAISKLAGLIFIEHAKGDEELGENILFLLDKIRKESADDFIQLDTETTQLDFFPPDNNVNIQFDKK